MRHLRILLSAAIIALFGGSLLAQSQSVAYYMNGGGSPVDLTATIVAPLSLTASNFTPVPPGTAVAGTTIHVGPGTPNEALHYSTGVNWSFSFSITNTDAVLGWEVSDLNFDVNVGTGVSGNYALFIDEGSGFFLRSAGGVTSLINPTWRSIASTISPTSVLEPGDSFNFRLDFFNFTGNGGYDVDSVGVIGTSFVAVPEPASIAAVGFIGTMLGCGLYARNRRRKLKRRTRSKQSNTVAALAR